jgi:hypothetical protein
MNRNSIFLRFALIVATFSGISLASSLVCSGEKVYFSEVHLDQGTPPLIGQVTAKNFLVYDRNVLFNYDSIAGQALGDFPSFGLTLTGPKKIIDQEGGSTAGFSTFVQMAIIQQVQPNIKVLGQEKVVCKKTWALVP